MPSANFMHRVYGIEGNKHVCSFRFYYELRLSSLDGLIFIEINGRGLEPKFSLLYQVQCSKGCSISNFTFLDGSERLENYSCQKIVVDLNGRSFDTLALNQMGYSFDEKSKISFRVHNLKKKIL